MLNYKKVLLTSNVDANNRAPEDLHSVYEQKLNNLKTQIKELKNDDNRDDTIENVFGTRLKNSLELNLSAALSLPANKKALNDMVKTLDDIITKKGSSLGEVKQSAENLLSLLKNKQTDNIYNEFSGMITADKLQNLNGFKDKEIDNLVNGIEGGIITETQALGLYNKMTKISIGEVNNFKSTDKEYFNKVIAALSKRLGLESNGITNVDNRLKESELKDIFGDGNYVENLNSITSQYTSINGWDGSNIDATKLKPDLLDGEKFKGKQFTAKEFADKFNEVNAKRISEVDAKVKGLIENANIDGITVNSDGEFVRDGKEISIKAILGITDKSIIGAQDADRLDLNILNTDELSKGHFANMRTEWTNAIKAKIEAKDKQENGEFVEGKKGEKTVAKVKSINSLFDGQEESKQFIKIEGDEDNEVVKYNVKKAKEYLEKILRTKYNGTDNNVSVRRWRENIKDNPGKRESLAWFAAAQILLNEVNKGQSGYQELELDGVWDENERIKEITKAFQTRYNEGKQENQKLVDDGVPGPNTVRALLAELDKTTQPGNGAGAIDQPQTREVSNLAQFFNGKEGFTPQNYSADQKAKFGITENDVLNVYKKSDDQENLYYQSGNYIVRVSIDTPWIKQKQVLNTTMTLDDSKWTSDVNVCKEGETKLNGLFNKQNGALKDFIGSDDVTVAIEGNNYVLENGNTKITLDQAILANKFCDKEDIVDKMKIVSLASSLKNSTGKKIEASDVWSFEKQNVYLNNNGLNTQNESDFIAFYNGLFEQSNPSV